MNTQEIYVGQTVARKNSRITAQPDTFFSIPARVKAHGKTVSGYVTCETLEGFSTETLGDPAVWRFIAYSYGKNGHLVKS